MSRSLALAALVAASPACTNQDNAKAKAGSRSRVEAIEAQADPRFEPSQFCEPWAEAGQARAFRFPALLAGAAPEPGPTRWVNVWATWCAPCVEEFPRIADWQARLAAAGHPAEVVFVSVDDAQTKIDAFAKDHPEVAGSLQIADPEQLPAWLVELGLPEGSVLPIHLFVDGAGELRCVRMGGVGPEDYPGVEAVVSAI